MPTYIKLNFTDQDAMVKDLKVTNYNDSTPINSVKNKNLWDTLTTDAYCDYNNNPLISEKYGRLYNWYVGSEKNPKNVCPLGWHVPSFKEWETLDNFNGGLGVAGIKLKEKGKEHWIRQFRIVTNESGFTALPAGSRASDAFSDLGRMSLWWSSTEDETHHNCGWCYIMTEFPGDTFYASAGKGGGFSVRCIKD